MANEKRLTAAEVSNLLEAHIAEHDLFLHDRLPAERNLAEQLGCSRGTVRAVLERWAKEGRVRRQIGQGTFLGSHDSSNIGPSRIVLDIASPFELLQSRIAIEPGVAALAASMASDKSLDLMRKHALATCNASDWQSYERADSDFHNSIAAATGNRVLVSLMHFVSSVRGRVAWQREHDQIFRHAHRKEYALAQGNMHLRIVEAIADRRPAKARSAMLEHLEAIAELVTDLPKR